MKNDKRSISSNRILSSNKIDSFAELPNIENQSASMSYFKPNINNNSASDNLKVFVRIRPPLQRELADGVPFRAIVNNKIYDCVVGNCIK